MGVVWDRIITQFIEIIEWLNDDHSTMVWRFPVRAQEIKNNAQLVVREGQCALFVNEGQLADVFGPGTYSLSTKNLPILATLRGWKYGFDSPFKAEVYFVSTTLFTDLKWGTKKPVMLRDPEFGPLRLRAFGNFTLRVKDPSLLMRQLVGTDSSFEVSDILGQLRRHVVSQFSQALANSEIPALDLAGNYGALAKKVSPIIEQEFLEFGLEMPQFLVENISFPAEVEQVLDRRSQMALVGGQLDTYSRYQMASAIPDAARTPNSLAGAGVGLAAGVQMGNQLADSQVPAGPPAAAAPATRASVEERLETLKDLLAKQLVTEDMYREQVQRILSEV